ncbi:MAG TPA: hypothetical protein VGI79_17745 [Caulobacteraceae bacterium]|jgi:hypothetical protein
MTNTVLKIVERAANFAGALAITAVLLAAAPSMSAMISATHLFSA